MPLIKRDNILLALTENDGADWYAPERDEKTAEVSA